MLKKTQDLLKKFEREHEVYVDAQDKKSYWIITARMPEKKKSAHRMKQYISARNAQGNILVVQNPLISEAYTIEEWGKIETFDDFVKKALTAILNDMEEYQEGCDTGCD